MTTTATYVLTCDVCDTVVMETSYHSHAQGAPVPPLLTTHSLGRKHLCEPCFYLLMARAEKMRETFLETGIVS